MLSEEDLLSLSKGLSMHEENEKEFRKELYFQVVWSDWFMRKCLFHCFFFNFRNNTFSYFN